MTTMRFDRLKSGLCLLALLSVAGLAQADDLAFSAKVDKTDVDVGSPVTLVLTLTGDISGVEFPKIELPDGLAVAAQSQSTNFAIRADAMERSASLTYVIVPQQAGTFKIGPFTIRHQKKEFQTETIDITVKKPALPPQFRPQGERFTL